MTARQPMRGAVCERCGVAYLTPHRDGDMCRPCFLGSLDTVDRIVALVSGGQSVPTP